MKESDEFQLLYDPFRTYNWVPFGRIHFGVFLIDGSKFNEPMMESNKMFARQMMKQVRLKNPLTMLSDPTAVLIYCAEEFDPSLVDHVRCVRMRKRRFRAHIVLYDPAQKKEFFREGIDNDTIHYYYKMQEQIEKGLRMAEKFMIQ